MNKLLLLAFLAVALAATVYAEKMECPKENEEYQCGSACQTTCRNLGQQCPIMNIKCNDACYCKKGYARDDHGKCIPIHRCKKYRIKTRSDSDSSDSDSSDSSSSESDCKRH